MRALTLHRPWPWAIFHAPHNPKRIENRPWKPWQSIINQRIALHAGKTFDSDAAVHLSQMYGLHPDGTAPVGWRDEGLIGVATVRGWAASPQEAEEFMVDQSEWFSGPYAWLLGDVVTFTRPIPCSGKQGLWELSVDLAFQVDAELNPERH